MLSWERKCRDESVISSVHSGAVAGDWLWRAVAHQKYLAMTEKNISVL